MTATDSDTASDIDRTQAAKPPRKKVEGIIDFSSIPEQGLIRQTTLRGLLQISPPTEWRWRTLGHLPALAMSGWYDCAALRDHLMRPGDKTRRSRAKLAA